MNFLKQNWFKLCTLILVSVIVVFVGYYMFSLSQKEKIKKQGEQNPLTSELSTTSPKLPEKQTDETKSDNYTLFYMDDGTPVTWTGLDLIAAILNDTLDTYKKSLPEIQKTYNTEINITSSAYQSLPRISDPMLKSKLQNMINLSEAYVASGGRLINFLSSSIQNYQGLINAIGNRNYNLYRYYNDEVEKLDAQKESILADYTNTGDAKRNYAKSIILPQ